jgi:hypothetical protein
MVALEDLVMFMLMDLMMSSTLLKKVIAKTLAL